MWIKIHFCFMLLTLWSDTVTSQLAAMTTAEETSSSTNATVANLVSSSMPVSTFESSTARAVPSDGTSSTHDGSSSSQPETSSRSTIPNVDNEAISSGLGTPAAVSSTITSDSTTTRAAASSSSVDPGTSLEPADSTEASSGEATSTVVIREETTTENQATETTTSVESTEDFTVLTVSVDSTTDVDSTTLATEVSTITKVDSTTFDSTTEPESTTYPTTIISIIIDGSSSNSDSATKSSTSSTTLSSEEPEPTDSTNDLPTAEGNKESCFGQAEVNTAMIIAIVVSVNVITIAVTAFCVHRLVSRRLSWDPPPMNFNKQRAAVSHPHPAPRTGINLASDNECRSGESPATQIPIVITNEDGWCVPYSEQDQKKKAANGTEDTGV